MADQYYVYAILNRDCPIPNGLGGLTGGAVLPVRYRELAAAASIVDPENIRPTTENLLLHESIVESLRESGPGLPVRFGTILSDAESVERALAEQYEVLMDDLRRVGDKVELGISALWRNPPADEEETPAADSASAPEGPGTRYLQARVADYRQEARLREKAETVAEGIDAVLSGHAVDRRATILPSPRVAVRAAYLLQPSHIDAFRASFEEARARFPELRFLLSGPWPPYTFVTERSGLPDRSSPQEEVRSKVP